MHQNNYPPYQKDLIEKARQLRKKSTPGEIELWKLIKNKQVLGYQFRRQRPVLNFIIDFYCKELALAIEIDGSSHDYKVGYDTFRQTKLEEIGITFLRFTEEDTKENPDYVVMEIENWIRSNATILPSEKGNISQQINSLTNASSSPRERKQRRGHTK